MHTLFLESLSITINQNHNISKLQAVKFAKKYVRIAWSLILSIDFVHHSLTSLPRFTIIQIILFMSLLVTILFNFYSYNFHSVDMYKHWTIFLLAPWSTSPRVYTNLFLQGSGIILTTVIKASWAFSSWISLIN